ncbi:ribosome-binding factor A [Alkaliphilus hydrothermalis]|uniref:Ribosome-binding factor A n=1 Tax=Alkaliphilus hydrothermalis TaxID=1482730 RepID=A0ABS2NL91_9FIRM|nr:30S ribosome-binding factor RbfA [Alkaliphilus hydrothermalis]MBM7613708.1 ribosome-binding factor A [Alkaliphilus hydrothermalis]
MAYPRVSRLNEELRKEISDIIRNDLRDPRIAPMTSIIEVDCTRDLSYATVYISVLGSEQEKKDTIDALKSSSGYVRREVGRRIKARITPEILFKLDNSIERGVEMHKTIARVIEPNQIEEEDNE